MVTNQLHTRHWSDGRYSVSISSRIPWSWLICNQGCTTISFCRDPTVDSYDVINPKLARILDSAEWKFTSWTTGRKHILAYSCQQAEKIVPCVQISRYPDGCHPYHVGEAHAMGDITLVVGSTSTVPLLGITGDSRINSVAFTRTDTRVCG